MHLSGRDYREKNIPKNDSSGPVPSILRLKTGDCEVYYWLMVLQTNY